MGVAFGSAAFCGSLGSTVIEGGGRRDLEDCLEDDGDVDDVPGFGTTNLPFLFRLSSICLSSVRIGFRSETCGRGLAAIEASERLSVISRW